MLKVVNFTCVLAVLGLLIAGVGTITNPNEITPITSFGLIFCFTSTTLAILTMLVHTAVLLFRRDKSK